MQIADRCAHQKSIWWKIHKIFYLNEKKIYGINISYWIQIYYDRIKMLSWKKVIKMKIYFKNQSPRRVLWKGVLRNFAKVFSCEFCEISKNTFKETKMVKETNKK